MEHSKHKALIKLKRPRYLTPAEQKEKTKHWPKGPVHEVTEKDKRDWQRKTGRGYNE